MDSSFSEITVDISMSFLHLICLSHFLGNNSSKGNAQQDYFFLFT